jgi:hypothetical protein
MEIAKSFGQNAAQQFPSNSPSVPPHQIGSSKQWCNHSFFNGNTPIKNQKPRLKLYRLSKIFGRMRPKIRDIHRRPIQLCHISLVEPGNELHQRSPWCLTLPVPNRPK